MKDKTTYKIELEKAIDEDKVIFYDYLMYKKQAGWCTGFGRNDDWSRPRVVKKARYNPKLLYDVGLNYYLGIPISDLIRAWWASGSCHACALALTLVFDDSKIVTANLTNYLKYRNIQEEQRGYKISDSFEHSFLLINNNGVDRVIDTTWGFITDYETYNKIMGLEDIRIIKKEEISKTKAYEILLRNCKSIIPYPDYINPQEYEEFEEKELIEFEKACKEYENKDNVHLQDFLNRCVYRTSHRNCVERWANNVYDKSFINYRDYPKEEMFSLEDDKYDDFLYSTNKKTNEENARKKAIQLGLLKDVRDKTYEDDKPFKIKNILKYFTKHKI